MPVSGEGRKGILLVGEAPGENEDKQNRQFVGKAGILLRKVLSNLGLDVDRDCWLTNALICHPENNETPTDDQIDYCRPNLMSTIRDLEPRLIIPMGFTAVKSLIAPYFRGEDEGTGSVSGWVGWKIPLQKLNAWVCPTYHPSYVARSEDDREGPVVRLWFERHLEAALGCEGRPWAVVPNYKNDVRIIMDPKDAASEIRKIIRDGRPTAWDYETNSLKPDRPEAEIITVGFCQGGENPFACPFTGEVLDATREFAESEVPKIGANSKFETRWTRKILGVNVKKWVWDTMLSAHHLDNRRGITSVKFQAFVRIGQEPWDGAVKPYLEADGATDLNRIKEVNLRTLLLYNGLDGTMEYLIAVHQKQEMKIQNGI